MKYDKAKIKPFKDRLIRMKYKAVENQNNQTGVISGIGEQHILFEPNLNGIEISIRYDRIKSIDKLKSRRATRLLKTKK